MSYFPKMAEIVQPGKMGIAEVSHYTVTRLDVLREMMHGGPCEEGRIAILRINGVTMMSDTRHEKITNYEVVRESRGNVLVVGLGLGMVVHAILAKDSVDHLTVVEKEADVVDLISPSLPVSDRLTVIHSDIFDWRPKAGTKYDTIYFDIWADAGEGKATSDRRKLSASFRKYKADGGWMGSWHPMVMR